MPFLSTERDLIFSSHFLSGFFQVVYQDEINGWAPFLLGLQPYTHLFVLCTSKREREAFNLTVKAQPDKQMPWLHLICIHQMHWFFVT